MLYWIIMIVLALGCAGMLAGTFISIKNANPNPPRPEEEGAGRRIRIMMRKKSITGQGEGLRASLCRPGTNWRKSPEKEKKTVEDYS